MTQMPSSRQRIDVSNNGTTIVYGSTPDLTGYLTQEQLNSLYQTVPSDYYSVGYDSPFYGRGLVFFDMGYPGVNFTTVSRYGEQHTSYTQREYYVEPGETFVKVKAWPLWKLPDGSLEKEIRLFSPYAHNSGSQFYLDFVNGSAVVFSLPYPKVSKQSIRLDFNSLGEPFRDALMEVDIIGQKIFIECLPKNGTYQTKIWNSNYPDYPIRFGGYPDWGTIDYSERGNFQNPIGDGTPTFIDIDIIYNIDYPALDVGSFIYNPMLNIRFNGYNTSEEISITLNQLEPITENQIEYTVTSSKHFPNEMLVNTMFYQEYPDAPIRQ